MQPSTQQTAPGAGVAGLPAGLLALVVVAGSAGLFATFWDDAWHTDLGRDQATIPPHPLLYASMATIGAVVAAWGLSALWRDRSPTALWWQPPLLLAAASGTVTLAALPIDAAWHASFGRDAVLWSPPHMLAVFGNLALLVGFPGGARPEVSPWMLTSLGALLTVPEVRGPARTQPVLHAVRGLGRVRTRPHPRTHQRRAGRRPGPRPPRRPTLGADRPEAEGGPGDVPLWGVHGRRDRDHTWGQPSLHLPPPRDLPLT
jgi:hypothetical protein